MKINSKTTCVRKICRINFEGVSREKYGPKSCFKIWIGSSNSKSIAKVIFFLQEPKKAVLQEEDHQIIIKILYNIYKEIRQYCRNFWKKHTVDLGYWYYFIVKMRKHTEHYCPYHMIQKKLYKISMHFKSIYIISKIN